jgi:uncharacterized protein YciI
MNVEEKIAALEKRLQAAEDHLEILRLLNSYGPLVDSGSSREAAELWVDGGAYDVGGVHRIIGHDDIAAMYDSEGHQELVNSGVSHLTATPRITVNGDEAEALAYSFVVLKKGETWFIWRASINHFKLARRPEGWKIVERFNRVLNGSKESHDTMRKGLS